MFSVTEINQYLACEFGLDEAHPERIPSNNWPFELCPVGVLGSGTTVFEFVSDGEQFYVLDGQGLNYLPKYDMSLPELEQEELGFRWLSQQEPLDLGASVLGDESVPSALERRAMLTKLGQQVSPAPEILEGVYLRRSRRSFGVVRDPVTDAQFVVGDGIHPSACAAKKLPAWRALAMFLGQQVGGAGGGA